MVLNDFQTYIKAVGTGPKGNKDLDFAQAEDMMTQLLSTNIYPESITAFLLGWRLKPETIEEFCGALQALDKQTIQTKVDNSIELGYAFDGKLKTPYLFPLIATLLQDLELVIVGDALQPAKNGITTQMLCSKLSRKSGFHYFDREAYAPALHDLTEIRQRLGLRTGLNTLEKLPNVAESAFAITGVHHTPYVKKYQAIFSARYKRFALIQGSEGSPELFSKGKLWVNSGETTQEYLIDPKFYGIAYEKTKHPLTLEVFLESIDNPNREIMKLAKLNVAILLFVTDKAKSIDEAYESLN